MISDPNYSAPDNPFVVKLIDSSGKLFSGKKIAVKHCSNGTSGILKALREYLNGEHKAQIIGIKSHAIIQPDILHNSVAEVRSTGIALLNSYRYRNNGIQ